MFAQRRNFGLSARPRSLHDMVVHHSIDEIQRAASKSVRVGSSDLLYHCILVQLYCCAPHDMVQARPRVGQNTFAVRALAAFQLQFRF